MKHHRAGDGERILAVFIDFENLALGFAGKRDRFRIEKVLERLVEKGKIVAKKAYADWSRFGFDARSLHEAAIELIEIPKRSMTGKNSADIRLVVDAVDLAYSKDHIDTFVIVSGDSDFSPLVSKLKELGKHVIGLGLVEATSNLLRDNCDEFIYYEDLDRLAAPPSREMIALPEPKQKVFGLLMESLLALRRENKETIFSSMAKDTMKRKRPSFNEEYFGYRTFSDLLEDAAKHGLIEIEKHKTSGTYVIARFGGEIRGPATSPVVFAPTLPHPQPLAFAKPAAPVAPAALPDTRPMPAAMRANPPAPAPPPVPLGPSKPVGPAAAGPRGPAASRPTTPPLPIRPSREEEDEEDDDLPVLGRSLMEEIDDDDLDEIPSYGTGRKSPPSIASPTRGPAKPPAKPAAPANAPPSRGRGNGGNPRPPADAKPQQPPRRSEPVPPPPPPPKPTVKPKPKDDEDSFGGGLDD